MSRAFATWQLAPVACCLARFTWHLLVGTCICYLTRITWVMARVMARGNFHVHRVVWRTWQLAPAVCYLARVTWNLLPGTYTCYLGRITRDMALVAWRLRLEPCNSIVGL